MRIDKTVGYMADGQIMFNAGVMDYELNEQNIEMITSK